MALRIAYKDKNGFEFVKTVNTERTNKATVRKFREYVSRPFSVSEIGFPTSNYEDDRADLLYVQELDDQANERELEEVAKYI